MPRFIELLHKQVNAPVGKLKWHDYTRNPGNKMDTSVQRPIWWRSPFAGAVFIVLVTILAYLPARHGGFLWDDDVLITENRMVKAPDGLRRFWFTTEAPDYYPLSSSLLWLEWRWWGNNAAGYRLLNVLLHAVNAVLVWQVLRRLKIPGAWLAGLIFAVHPVNVATVGWISEQKTTLSMLFYTVAILLYLRFDEERHWRWYGLSIAAFLLALLSKSAVVMLPVVLLGCIWWARGRVQRRDIVASLPFFALSLLTGLLAVWIQHNVLLGQTVRTASFAGRLAAAGWFPWFYLLKAVLPFDLNVIYPKWEIDPTNWIIWLPAAVLVGCFLIFGWQRKTWGRPLLFGLGYFVMSLFPVLGFFDQGFYRFSLVADHWQYYAIVGVIALGIAAGNQICGRITGGSRSPKVLASVIVLLALGIGTWKRSSVYASDELLWKDTLAKNPNAWVAHNNLGIDLFQAGQTEEAIGHYEQALQLNPNYAEAENNWGTALSRAGKTEEAIRHYRQALRLDPDYAEAHYNLGVTSGQVGKVPEALDHLEQALRLDPDYAEAHYYLAIALVLSNRKPEAIKHLQQALQLKPDFTEAQNALARLQAGQ